MEIQANIFKKRAVIIGLLMILAVELLCYFTPLSLGFIVQPIEAYKLKVPSVSYHHQQEAGLNENSENFIYLKTKLSPRIYRYHVDLTTIPELAELVFVEQGYKSSLELWSTPNLSELQTNSALRNAMSQASISGEIFLPKLKMQTTIPRVTSATKTKDKVIICYLKLVGELNNRLSNSYGLDLNLTEEYVGFSYSYQVGVDKFGKVQYVLPLSRVDAQMGEALVKALWQLPFEPALDSSTEDIEWGRVKIEFDY